MRDLRIRLEARSEACGRRDQPPNDRLPHVLDKHLLARAELLQPLLLDGRTKHLQDDLGSWRQVRR